jgi:hypothetical protein
VVKLKEYIKVKASEFRVWLYNTAFNLKRKFGTLASFLVKKLEDIRCSFRKNFNSVADLLTEKFAAIRNYILTSNMYIAVENFGEALKERYTALVRRIDSFFENLAQKIQQTKFFKTLCAFLRKQHSPPTYDKRIYTSLFESALHRIPEDSNFSIPNFQDYLKENDEIMNDIYPLDLVCKHGCFPCLTCDLTHRSPGMCAHEVRNYAACSECERVRAGGLLMLAYAAIEDDRLYPKPQNDEYDDFEEMWDETFNPTKYRHPSKPKNWKTLAMRKKLQIIRDKARELKQQVRDNPPSYGGPILGRNELRAIRYQAKRLTLQPQGLFESIKTKWRHTTQTLQSKFASFKTKMKDILPEFLYTFFSSLWDILSSFVTSRFALFMAVTMIYFVVVMYFPKYWLVLSLLYVALSYWIGEIDLSKFKLPELKKNEILLVKDSWIKEDSLYYQYLPSEFLSALKTKYPEGIVKDDTFALDFAPDDFVLVAGVAPQGDKVDDKPEGVWMDISQLKTGIFGSGSLKDVNERLVFVRNMSQVIEIGNKYGFEAYKEVYHRMTGEEYIDPKYRPLIMDIKRLSEEVDKHKLLSSKDVSYFKDPTRVLAVQADNEELKSLRRKLLSIPAPRVYMAAWRAVMEASDELNEQMTRITLGQHQRCEPLTIHFHGPAGVGKSTAYRPFLNYLCRVMGLAPLEPSHYYNHNLNDPYYSGCNNTKRVFVFDDPLQSLDPKDRLRVAEEIIKVVNVNVYKVNMADLESKGTTFVTPDFVILTSNDEEPIPYFGKLFPQTSMEAITRRIHVSIYVDRYSESVAIPPNLKDVKMYLTRLKGMDNLSDEVYNYTDLASVIAPVALQLRQSKVDSWLDESQNEPIKPPLSLAEVRQRVSNRKIDTKSRWVKKSASAALAVDNPPEPQNHGIEDHKPIPIPLWERVVSKCCCSVKNLRSKVMNALDAWNKLITVAIVVGFVVATISAIGLAYLLWKKLRRTITPHYGDETEISPLSRKGARIKRARHFQQIANEWEDRPNMSHAEDEEFDGIYDRWMAKMELAADGLPKDIASRLVGAVKVYDEKDTINFSQGFRDRAKKYLKNIVRLGLGKFTCPAIALDKRTILAPAHLFPEKFPVLQVMIGGSIINYNAYKLELPVTGADVVFVHLLGDKAASLPVTAIHNHFADGARVSREVYYVRRFSNADFIVAKGATSIERSLTYDSYRMVEHVFRAEILTVKGDSGTLVCDPRDGSILGFHVAAKDDHAYWYRVPKELLPPASPDPVTPQAEFSLKPGVIPSCSSYIGKIKSFSHMPHESSYHPSPIYGAPEFPPPNKAPALLAKNRVVDPLKVAYSKFTNKPPVPIPEDVAKGIANQMATEIPAAYLPMVLSIHQSLEGAGIMRPLDMSRAAGPKYKNQGYVLKRDIPKDVLLRDIAQMDVHLRAGIEVYPCASDCLKDELREHDKVLKGKTRLFQVMDADFVAIWRRYFGCFFDAHIRGRERSFIKIGINPHGPEWKRFYHRHRSFNAYGCINGDFEGWDFHQLKEIFDIDLDVIQSWYEINFKNVTEPHEFAEAHSVRNLLWKTVHTTYVVVGDDLYVVYNKFSSGHGGTGTVNSLSQEVVFRLAFDQIVKLPPTRYKDMVASDNYGDDGPKTPVPPIVPVFNQLTISKWFKENLGLVYLNDRKQPFTETLTPWSQATFLKRSFVDRDTHVDAPQNLLNITTSLQWITGKPEDALDLLDLKLLSAQYEFTHFGPQSYAVLQAKLDSCTKRINFDYRRLTFQEAFAGREAAYEALF